MPRDEDVDQFDELFAEIMAAPEATAVAEVADEPEVVSDLISARNAVIKALIESPEVIETAKPDRAKKERVEYKTVDKVEVEGGPCQTKCYPLGYATLSWSQGFRFQNKVCLYRSDLVAFVEFCRDKAKSDEWLAALEAAGHRERGEARKEG